MDAKESGLSLEALAKRLEALEGENERMRSESERIRSENAELKDVVTALKGSGTRGDDGPVPVGYEPPRDGKAASGFEGKVSRRSVLSKAGAAAVAAVAAGTLLGSSPRRAEAHNATNDISADEVTAHYLRAVPHEDVYDAIYARITSDFGYGVFGINDGSAAGVKGHSAGGSGVSGHGYGLHEAGVKGEGPTGVWGVTSKTEYSGVYGEHTGTSGHGTVGIGKGGHAGVRGRNPSSEGVRGEGKTGVFGIGSDETATGVRGEGWIGVRGESTDPGSVGILGRNDNGSGVQGDGRNGVFGRGSSGYGGFFEGGKAQLRLRPAGSVGKPTSGSHSAGEIFMDKAGTLFVCVAATTSTAAAKWRKVTTTAV